MPTAMQSPTQYSGYALGGDLHLPVILQNLHQVLLPNVGGHTSCLQRNGNAAKRTHIPSSPPCTCLHVAIPCHGTTPLHTLPYSIVLNGWAMSWYNTPSYLYGWAMSWYNTPSYPAIQYSPKWLGHVMVQHPFIPCHTV